MILCADEAYAGISRSDWEAIAAQLNVLQPVQLRDIGPEDQQCDICRERFDCSDHREYPEQPVSLPCGHIFGKNCLKEWIAIGKGRDCRQHENDLDDDQPFEDFERPIGDFDDGKLDDLLPDSAFSFETNDFACPKCRQNFTVSISEEQAPAIKALLDFWDHAYEKLGITRSADEERCRDHLLCFVSKTKAKPITHTSERDRLYSLERRAQVAAMRFALRRGRWDLTPVQRCFRDGFFHLGCYGVNDSLKAYRAEAYENRLIPLWCWQFDRIERGMNPSYAWSRGSYHRQCFFDERLEQRMGPWMRTLFKKLDDDRLAYHSGEGWNYSYCASHHVE